MSTSQTTPQPSTTAGVSMRDLLASCAAARAVSTPPRPFEPAEARPAHRPPTATGHREAA